MWVAPLMLMFSLLGTAQDVDPLEAERSKITIISTAPLTRMGKTDVDGGPSVGDILNNHFFPAVAYFKDGRYALAAEELNYVLLRPTYIEMNAKQAEYMSTAHYLRGMVYLYHADGFGRHSLARSDFEGAVKWNPNNYAAYLELSRVYSALGLKAPAETLLKSLGKFELDDKLKADVDAELKKLGAGAGPTPTTSAPPARPNTPSTPVTARVDNNTKPVEPAPAPKPAAPRMGKIAINSLVWADVYTAGKHLGSTPLTIELPEGDAQIEYRHGDLKAVETYTVKPNETITAIAAFELVVDINAKPWAEVIVEGKQQSLGQTPLTGIRIPAGANLVFRNPGFQEKRYTVLSTDRSISISF